MTSGLSLEILCLWILRQTGPAIRLNLQTYLLAFFYKHCMPVAMDLSRTTKFTDMKGCENYFWQ